MKPSVIIVNWNTKDLLKQCLTSIYVNLDELSFEVIVIDNASKDGSSQMVKSDFSQVNLIENKENLGFSKANNAAIEHAKGNFILLLNPDTIFLDNSIMRIINFIDENDSVGLISCKLLNEDLSVQKSCWFFPYLWWKLIGALGIDKILPKFYKKFNFDFENSERAIEVDWVKGAFMLVRNIAFREIGGLSEKFFMYGEDMDLCFRLKKAGWKIYYYPEARIVHLENRSGELAWGDQRIFKVEEATYLFYKNNYARLNYILLILIHCLHHLNIILWNEIKNIKYSSLDIDKRIKNHKRLLRMSLNYITK